MTKAANRVSNLQLLPIIQQLITKVQSFNEVVQVISSSATPFPIFSEFQVSQSTPLPNTTSIPTPIPNVLFSSPSPATTPLVGKSRSTKHIAAPKAKRAKVLETSPVVDLIGEDPP